MTQNVQIRDPEQGHRDFWSVVDLLNFDPRYSDQVLPGLYAQHTAFAHIGHVVVPTEPNDEISENIKKQRDMGVLINHVWSAKIDSTDCLAQYCGFGSAQELTAYTDMIVPDIVHEAAFIASNPEKETQENATGDVLEFQNFIEEHHFYDLGGPNWRGRVHRYDFTETFVKPSPIDLLKAYHEKPQIRQFVDQVVELCPEPTFTPARNTHFREDIFWHKSIELCPEAFVLSHAVQILLFAPQDWSPDPVYTQDVTQYEHRFPTPDFIGGGTARVVAGRFSMEDLHRAILLFYYLVGRRKRGNWVGIVPDDNGMQFPGYHNPDDEDAEDDNAASEAELPDDSDQVQTASFALQLRQYCVIL